MKNILRLTQVLNLGEEKLYSLTRPIYAHENEAPTYHVKIGRDPSCSCPYSQKSTTICKHMLWVMLFQLNIAEDSYLLHQKAFTPTEVKEICKCDNLLSHHTSTPQRSTPQAQANLSRQTDPNLANTTTDNEYEQIFQKHPHHSQTQTWTLCRFKKQHGRIPMCAGCHNKPITDNSLQITVSGLYIPKHTKFCVVRVYHFCPNNSCITSKPPGSNLSPPTIVTVDGIGVSSTDVEQAIAVGIPIQ